MLHQAHLYHSEGNINLRSSRIMQNDWFNNLYHMHWQHAFCKAMRKFLRLHAFAEKNVNVFRVYLEDLLSICIEMSKILLLFFYKYTLLPDRVRNEHWIKCQLWQMYKETKLLNRVAQCTSTGKILVYYISNNTISSVSAVFMKLI